MLTPRSSRIAAYVLGAWLSSAGSGRAEAVDDFAFYHENVMGTSLELRARAAGIDAARKAEERVLGEIDRLTQIFSGYNAASEFHRWQAAPRSPVRVSAELFAVLDASDGWRTRTAGAFDPRVQALTRLWSQCAARGRGPTKAEVAEASALMSRPAWRLDAAARTAEHLSDCPLSLNSIAKGYIIERAASAGLGEGIAGLVLNIGGDVRVCGDAARTIGIADPSADSETTAPIAYVAIRNQAIATSGNYQRGFRIEGRWYSHIFDPRTKAPTEGVASATVIAPRSADANALATSLNVLSPEEGVRLVNTMPEAACLIVAIDGRVVRSNGWQRYERRSAEPLESSAVALADIPSTKGKDKTPAGDAWGDTHELIVNFEINRPPSTRGRYRRPYVAVWVEDKNGSAVRNLELWVSMGGAGPWQWLPDLKRWHRSDEDRKKVDKTDMVLTISRATRPPGKYTIIWDGKDDHGKPLPRGEYTLLIDAAREHGTYQSIRKQITIADKPFAEELKGNVEIRAASIEYRRKKPAK